MCLKEGANKSAVPRHERTHEKPYACSMCPMQFRFARSRSARQHGRTHNDEALLLDYARPVLCQIGYGRPML